MKKTNPCAACSIKGAAVFLLLPLAVSSGAWAVDQHPLLDIMQSELELSMEKLVSPEGTKPYFIQYAVTDEKDVYISASLGALTRNRDRQTRQLDVDVRSGDYALDNTHQIRGAYFGGHEYWRGAASLPLNDDPIATRHAIWLQTDKRFKAAVKRYAQVKANVKVKVEEEDQSDDFTREEPSTHLGPWLEQPVDVEQLAQRVKKYSRRFRAHPLIYNSSVSLSGNVTNRLAVNSEGSKIQFGRGWWRIGIQASTIAADGHSRASKSR